MPSLKQLNEAIASYHADHPDVLMTVVVDATFGHRIETREVADFEKAIETNAFVAPPAGAVGRGDGFILSIAQKANASILSNDSYQEFHGEYAWLFDEGRLIGGKPVPHVGWVWVNRVPVRGPISRRSVKEQKIVDKSPTRRRGVKRDADAPSISANGPMPIPTSLPPGAVMPGARRMTAADVVVDAVVDEALEPNAPSSKARRGRGGKGEGRRSDTAQDRGRQETGRQDQGDQGRHSAGKTTNDLLAFLSFVEHFPVGTAVTGVVESYSSHGAYVAIGDVHGYVSLRLMADPAPRSAREAMAIGETVTLVVSSFGAARRSIDLAAPSMAPVVAPAAPKTQRGAAKRAAATAAIEAAAVAAASPGEAAALDAAAATPPARRKREAKSAATAPGAKTSVVETAAVVTPAAAEPTPAATSIAKSGSRPVTKRTPARRGPKQADTAATIDTAATVNSPTDAASVPFVAVAAASKRAAPRRSAARTEPAPPAAAPAEPAPAKKASTRRQAASQQSGIEPSEKPSGQQPSEQPSGKQSSGRKPSGKQPNGKQPAGKRQAGKQQSDPASTGS